MKKVPFSRLLRYVITVLVGLSVVGCASPQPASYTHQQLPIHFEPVASDKVHIPTARAYQVGEEMVISGHVKRRPDNCCDTTKGTVQLMVIDPEGEILDTVTIPHSPRNIPKTRTRSASFSARLPYVLPDDMIVRIAYRPQGELLEG